LKKEQFGGQDERTGKGKVVRLNGVGAVTAAPRGASQSSPPDPEVVEKPGRRKFTAEYKERILREADRCAPGELGALLRREGLYSSHLTKWRRQRDEAIRAGLTAKQRGRKPQKPDPAAQRIAELQRENERLRQRLQQAETIIEVQKKISEILGITPKDEKN